MQRNNPRTHFPQTAFRLLLVLQQMVLKVKPRFQTLTRELGGMVNVFLSQPVLVFVCHTWAIGAWRWVTPNRKNRFAVSMLMLDSQSSWRIYNKTDHTEESIMSYSLLIPWLSVLLSGGLERDKSQAKAVKWNWLCFLWSWKFWAPDREVSRAEYLGLLPAVMTVS